MELSEVGSLIFNRGYLQRRTPNAAQLKTKSHAQQFEQTLLKACAPTDLPTPNQHCLQASLCTNHKIISLTAK
jgi:hypothetical protein